MRLSGIKSNLVQIYILKKNLTYGNGNILPKILNFICIICLIMLTQTAFGKGEEYFDHNTPSNESLPTLNRKLVSTQKQIDTIPHLESGRRRDCSRRPPTPPGIRFRTTAVHVTH
jgi:hypothetical protein